MNKNREQRHKKYRELLAMRAEVEEELLKIPGVVRVKVGARVRKGLAIEELCFRVYVDHKKNISEIPEKERIPATIRNIKTDVNQISKKASACGARDGKKYRPVCGGTRLKSSRSSTDGTLGCLAIDGSSGEVEIVLLSTFHVLMSNGEQPGHQVGQPDFFCDRCPCRCGEIAKLVRGAWNEENVDCAIAKLTGKHEQHWVNEILEVGPVTSFPLNDQGNPVEEVEPLETVFKRGMGSSHTEGLVIENDATIDMTYPGDVVHQFTNQLLIGPKDFDKPFSRKGDSGAVVINHLNQVVGLIYGDNEDRAAKIDATETYANPIQDVIKALDISIPDTGTLASIPLRSASETNRADERDLLEELEHTIAQYADGNLLLSAFKKHWEEVMQLINTEREVKLAWNRYQGPSFIAHLMEKMKMADYKMPVEIQGISWQRLLSKMSVVLEKNGSPEMSSDIERHSAKAFFLIDKMVRSFKG